MPKSDLPGETAAVTLAPTPSTEVPKRGRSIVLKLTGLVALVLIPVEVGLLVAGHHFWREMMITETRTHLSGLVANRAELVQSQIQLLRQRVALSADRAEFRRVLVAAARGTDVPEDRATAQRRLSRSLPDKKVILSASLLDTRGRVLLSSEPALVGRDLSAQADFKAGLRESHMGAPRQNGEKFSAMLLAPVMDKAEIVGVLMMAADISPLAHAVRNTAELGTTGDVLLIGRDNGQLRSLLPGREGSVAIATPLSNGAGLEALCKSSEGFTRMRDQRGVEVLAAARPIGYATWWLVSKMDEREAWEPLEASLRWRLVAGVVAALLGLAAVYGLVHRFTRPIRRLAEAAGRVSQGDYHAEVPAKTDDELGVLARSFNAMVAAIRHQQVERDGATRALSEANRRKDEFLAMLGHELRNPLSAIASATQMWQEADDDPATVEQMREVITRQTSSLKRLMDDLLDVARIATGKIDLQLRPLNLGGLLRQSVEAIRPHMQVRRHELVVSLSEQPIYLQADATRLEQIINNLLGNAAKYTPDGGHIALVEKLEGEEAVITVSDNGIGIEPEVLERIFELFTQANLAIDRSTGGLGIGLNLCRRLVELHGGIISAESDGLGRGARFTVRLPVTRALPTPIEEAAPRKSLMLSGAPLRIMLVDDNEETVLLLSRLLTRRGHQVLPAFDGLSALSAAKEFQPHVFLLDIGLPGLDGYSLARRLKAEGFGDALLIAISGYAQEHDREDARAAGFAHHFSKPVDFDALTALLSGAR